MLILLLSTNKRLFSDISSYNIFFENFFAKVLTFLIGLSIIKSNKSISLEVGSCPLYNEDYGINIGYYWQMGGAPACILVSDSAIERLSDNLSVDNIIADCDPKAESYVL
jgi:hypothetical protein